MRPERLTPSGAHPNNRPSAQPRPGAHDGWAAKAPARTARDRARRELSQNFLRDAETVHRVVRAAALGPDDLVLEVGAGEGPLTVRLAAVCRAVEAYELDPRLADRLRARRAAGGPWRRVRVVHGDFRAAVPPAEPFAVVGNIPYAITSDVVDWCLRAPGLTAATLVTQWEYARKRTGDYGRWSLLTVRTWPEFHWRLLGRIDRRRFRPVPRVDSGLLRLERRPVPLLPAPDAARYRALVEYGFTGVGGSLFASLCRRYPTDRVAAALAACGVERGAVVGHVHPDQWVALFRRLEPPAESRRRPRRAAPRW
ncbi:ErmE/ErmH/ErmO/ErmR family 23S rRNA (adenine(2058)-N(6))-methyltransferase [Allostreptomyces psammosilenae]|uniref:23S rRNA (Adenine-N6)-dimethyltransferase n=1 Tax=Allostreptomyces psammosilenae TaxID=1892865 RepID=A0A852ZSM0_9ACTN|nr:ErmE/ErmH/ErmO/ErmR family 23S rRNA (adenine(2058)-N(6))-methyltransferase [Allostreptomyces psammosilenae]NYI04825.1 23S rRNA (adenine-N6)-dimethyltransferase [Allostreptomyces psammosilenae]